MLDTLRLKRQAVEQELLQTKERASQAEGQANALNQRVIALHGAVAVLNDLIRDMEQAEAKPTAAQTTTKEN